MMRTTRLALALFLISSTASVWAQSSVSILDSWVVDGSYAAQNASFNVSTGTDRLVLVALSAEKNGSGPMSVTSVSLGNQVLTEVFDFTVGGSGGYHNLNWLGYLPESQIAALSGSTLNYSICKRTVGSVRPGENSLRQLSIRRSDYADCSIGQQLEHERIIATAWQHLDGR